MGKLLSFLGSESVMMMMVVVSLIRAGILESSSRGIHSK